MKQVSILVGQTILTTVLAVLFVAIASTATEETHPCDAFNQPALCKDWEALLPLTSAANATIFHAINSSSGGGNASALMPLCYVYRTLAGVGEPTTCFRDALRHVLPGGLASTMASTDTPLAIRHYGTALCEVLILCPRSFMSTHGKHPDAKLMWVNLAAAAGDDLLYIRSSEKDAESVPGGTTTATTFPTLLMDSAVSITGGGSGDTDAESTWKLCSNEVWCGGRGTALGSFNGTCVCMCDSTTNGTSQSQSYSGPRCLDEAADGSATNEVVPGVPPVSKWQQGSIETLPEELAFDGADENVSFVVRNVDGSDATLVRGMRKVSDATGFLVFSTVNEEGETRPRNNETNSTTPTPSSSSRRQLDPEKGSLMAFSSSTTSGSSVLFEGYPPQQLAEDASTVAVVFSSNASSTLAQNENATSPPPIGSVQFSGISKHDVNFGPISEDNPRTITVWMRASSETDGFVYLVVDNWLSGETRSAPLTAVALKMMEEKLASKSSKSTTTDQLKEVLSDDVFPVYSGLYAHGPENKLYFVFSSGNDLKTFSWEKEKLFDDTWHMIAMQLTEEGGRRFLHLFVDGETSFVSASGWRQCLPHDDSVNLKKVRESSGETASSVSVPNSITDTVFGGGALHLGALQPTSKGDLHLFNLEVHDSALSQREVVLLGAEPMSRYAFILIQESVLLGVLLGTASISTIVTLIHFFYVDIYAVSGNDVDLEALNTLLDQKRAMKFAKKRGKKVMAARRTLSKKAGQSKAMQKLGVIFPIAIAPAQSMILFFRGFGWPLQYKNPVAVALFAFSLDLNLVFPGIPFQLTPILQFAFTLAVTGIFMAISSSDNNVFEQKVIEGERIRLEEEARAIEEGEDENSSLNRASTKMSKTLLLKKQRKLNAGKRRDENIPQPELFPKVKYEYGLVELLGGGATAVVNNSFSAAMTDQTEQQQPTREGRVLSLTAEANATMQHMIDTLLARGAMKTPSPLAMPLKFYIGETNAGATAPPSSVDSVENYVTVQSVTLNPAADVNNKTNRDVGHVVWTWGPDPSAAISDSPSNGRKQTGTLRIINNTRLCPLHGCPMIDMVDGVHTLVPLLPDGSEPYTCGHEASPILRRARGPSCDPHLLVCPHNECGFATCINCYTGWNAAQQSVVSTRTKLWAMKKAGVKEITGNITIIVAQALFVPGLMTALMILSCHPSYQCHLEQNCYNSLDGDYLGLVVASAIVVFVMGFIFIGYMAKLLIDRKLMIIESGLWSYGLTKPPTFGELVCGCLPCCRPPPEEEPKKKAAIEEKKPTPEQPASNSQTQQQQQQQSTSSTDAFGASVEGASMVTVGPSPKSGDDAAHTEESLIGILPPAPTTTAKEDEEFADIPEPYVPVTYWDKVRCGMEDLVWRELLETDSTVLKILYENFECGYMCVYPLLLIFKFVIVAAVVLLPSASLSQLVVTSFFETLQLAFIGVTNAMIDPWLDILSRCGSLHSVIQLCFLSFHRVMTSDEPKAVGLVFGMIAASIAYVAIVIIVLIFDVVLPFIRARRRQNEDKERQREERLAEREEALKAKQHEMLQTYVDTSLASGTYEVQKLKQSLFARSELHVTQAMVAPMREILGLLALYTDPSPTNEQGYQLLTTINLASCVSSELAEPLCHMINENKVCTKLNISNNNLDVHTLKAISEALKSNATIETLEMRSSLTALRKLSPKTCGATTLKFVSFLSKNQTLTSVDFSQNPSFKALLLALGKTPNTLRQLLVEGCWCPPNVVSNPAGQNQQVVDVATNGIAAIIAQSPKAEHLSFAGNFIGDGGIPPIVIAINKLPTSSAVLRDLNIARSHITGVDQLCDVLRKNRSMTALSASRCNFDVKNLKKLVQTAVQSPTLKTLDVADCCKLKGTEEHALTKSLEGSHCLSTLVLHESQLHEPTAAIQFVHKNILTAPQNTPVDLLSIHDVALEGFILQGNNQASVATITRCVTGGMWTNLRSFGVPKVAQLDAIVKMLIRHAQLLPALEAFNFADCSCLPTTIETFLDRFVFVRVSTVKELNFSGTMLSATAIKTLSDLLSDEECVLRVLDVSHCPFTGRGDAGSLIGQKSVFKDELIASFGKNMSLEVLSLAGTKLTKEAMDALVAVLRKKETTGGGGGASSLGTTRRDSSATLHTTAAATAATTANAITKRRSSMRRSSTVVNIAEPAGAAGVPGGDDTTRRQQQQDNEEDAPPLDITTSSLPPVGSSDNFSPNFNSSDASPNGGGDAAGSELDKTTGSISSASGVSPSAAGAHNGQDKTGDASSSGANNLVSATSTSLGPMVESKDDNTQTKAQSPIHKLASTASAIVAVSSGPPPTSFALNLRSIDLSENTFHVKILLTFIKHCKSLVYLKATEAEGNIALGEVVSRCPTIEELDLSKNEISLVDPEKLFKTRTLRIVNISDCKFSAATTDNLVAAIKAKQCHVQEWRIRNQPHATAARLLRAALHSPHCRDIDVRCKGGAGSGSTSKSLASSKSNPALDTSETTKDGGDSNLDGALAPHLHNVAFSLGAGGSSMRETSVEKATCILHDLISLRKLRLRESLDANERRQMAEALQKNVSLHSFTEGDLRPDQEKYNDLFSELGDRNKLLTSFVDAYVTVLMKTSGLLPSTENPLATAPDPFDITGATTDQGTSDESEDDLAAAENRQRRLSRRRSDVVLMNVESADHFSGGDLESPKSAAGHSNEPELKPSPRGTHAKRYRAKTARQYRALVIKFLSKCAELETTHLSDETLANDDANDLGGDGDGETLLEAEATVTQFTNPPPEDSSKGTAQPGEDGKTTATDGGDSTTVTVAPEEVHQQQVDAQDAEERRSSQQEQQIEFGTLEFIAKVYERHEERLKEEEMLRIEEAASAAVTAAFNEELAATLKSPLKSSVRK